MRETFCNNLWYALFVRTGEEDKVKARVEYRMSEYFRAVVPKRRLRERRQGKWEYRTRTLFPGYVLLNGDMHTETYYMLKGIPGLIRLLRTGFEPARIDPDEIELLSRITCNEELIGFSDVLLQDGKVRVVDGPLVALEGRILSVDHRKGRAKVSMTFLGEERIVELGVNVLRPA